MLRIALSFVVFSLMLGAPAFAQENIVVTGTRITSSLGGRYAIPHVTLTRRADYLLRTVWVYCDTRESEQRADELRQTLRGMLSQSESNASIVLSRLVEIDDGGRYGDASEVIVVPFTLSAIDGAFSSNFQGRSDTSYMQLVVKTAIGPEDTIEAAVKRIMDFTEDVRRVGRGELQLDGDDALSVVDPAQYRDEIFTAMSADANARITALGEGYAAEFEGLENQVAWYRSDALALRLFIPHHLTIRSASR